MVDRDEGLIFWSQSRCVFGWASSRILDADNGEVAETWPLGLRTLSQGFSRDGLTVESLQAIDGRLHWKFVSSEGIGLYIDCHDYTVWNGSPRPPFEDKEWQESVKDAIEDATKAYHERIEWWNNALPPALVDDETY